MTHAEGELHGLPVLWLENAHCRAALSLHGGQLLAFVPHGFDDLLWLSPLGRGSPGAIRGGVPVCWPYFGREGQAAGVPQHGFARTSTWQLEAVHEAGDDIVVELSLPENAATPLRARQTLRLGHAFEQALTTRNTGVETVAFTQALHSYFRVGDASRVTVSGLEGLEYADRYDGGVHVQSGDWDLHDPRDPGRSDRTYRDAGGRYALRDPVLNRRIDLATAGSRALVVWNPGVQGIAAIADAPAEGWRGFVCLEAANAGADVVTLAPGETHTLQQTISVAPL